MEGFYSVVCRECGCWMVTNGPFKTCHPSHTEACPHCDGTMFRTIPTIRQSHGDADAEGQRRSLVILKQTRGW